MDILDSCAQSSKRCVRNCFKKQANEITSQNIVILKTMKSPKNMHFMKEKFSNGIKKSLKLGKPMKKRSSPQDHMKYQEPQGSRKFPIKPLKPEIKKMDQSSPVAHFRRTPQLKPSHRRVETLGFISPPSVHPVSSQQIFQTLPPQKNSFLKKLSTKPIVPETKKINFCYFMPQTTKTIITYPTDSATKISQPKTIYESRFERPIGSIRESKPLYPAGRMISSYQYLRPNSEYQLIQGQKQISKSIKYQNEELPPHPEYNNENESEEKAQNPQKQEKKKRKKSFIPEEKIEKSFQHGRSRSDFHRNWQELIQSSNFDEEEQSNARNFSRDLEVEEKESTPHIVVHLPRVNTSELPENIKQEQSQNDSENDVNEFNLSTITVDRLDDLDFCRKTRSIHDSSDHQDQFSDVIEQGDLRGTKFRKFLTLPMNMMKKLSQQPSFSTINFKNVRSRKQSMREST